MSPFETFALVFIPDLLVGGGLSLGEGGMNPAESIDFGPKVIDTAATRDDVDVDIDVDLEVDDGVVLDLDASTDVDVGWLLATVLFMR